MGNVFLFTISCPLLVIVVGKFGSMLIEWGGK